MKEDKIFLSVVAEADGVQSIQGYSTEIAKDIQLENRMSSVYLKCPQTAKLEVLASSDAHFSNLWRYAMMLNTLGYVINKHATQGAIFVKV